MGERRVKVFQYVPPGIKVEKCYAKFHQFGMDYVEFDSGPASFSTAIIEYDDGHVDNVPVHMIQFVE